MDPVYNFHSNFSKNTADVRRSKSSLIFFFQPDFIQDIALVSAPPWTLSTSPREQK